MKTHKLSPGLLVALEDFSNEGELGLMRSMHTLGLSPNVGSPQPPKTVVFVHCTEDADLDYLAPHDVTVNQRAGRVRTAYLPLASLAPLSDAPEVDRIVSSRYLRPLMDAAPGAVKLPLFRSNSGLGGRGTIVGVIDSGIDPLHPAFTNRILSIWDQTMPGGGVGEGKYGAELTGPMLNVSRDFNGHGTHVAGIAAGSEPAFGGVAPDAQLVIVKTSFQNAHIADGIRYIFRVARERQLPAVVNLSLGGHFDAHDGTDSLSQIIDSESGAGRIVCCAAGNEGTDNIHAQVLMKAKGKRTLNFSVPPNLVADCLLNGWYPGTASFEISVTSPAGHSTEFRPVVTNANPVKTFNLPDGRVRVTTPGPDPTNGDHHFLVQIDATTLGGAVAGGVWKLVVRNPSAVAGQLDVWTLDDQEAPTVLFSNASATASSRIGSPGSAAGAVTVASFTTKNQWSDMSGAQRATGLTLNDISDFSSEGPLRNGARKPDVAAPGAMIVSALSSKATNNPANIIDATHVIKAGTSMATPFVSGLVALLLERDPTLDPSRLKALLQANSRIPSKPAGAFDPKWGFGLISALNL
jgi:subtilisin family serine protease